MAEAERSLALLPNPGLARTALEAARAQALAARRRDSEARAALDRLARDAEARGQRLAAIGVEEDAWRKRREGATVQRTNGVVSKERVTASWQPRYGVDERIYAFGLAQYEHDRFLGFDSARSCPYARGVISTAALGTDPATGTRAVYVGGGDGYLYALRASDGKIIWRAHVVQTGTTTQNAGYLWSSPLVIGGRVYMGVSSDCDVPLIRGGLKVFSQRTGRFLHTYWAVPRGTVGGSVWTSPASDGRSVWITTGNADPAASQPGDSFSMVRLAPSTLSRLQKWTVPNLAGTDLDWGSSPTLFSARVGGVATPMVGACNKNGVFYAFRANHLYAGPLWSRQIGTAPGLHRGMCLGAAVWDQADHRLIVGSNLTTISGTSSPGAVRALAPATGHVVWETGTPAGPIQGSPSSDGGGVVAAATFDLQTNQNVLYLLNGSSGDVVGTKTIGSPEFAQPVFADDHLFVATVDAGLTAFLAP